MDRHGRSLEIDFQALVEGARTGGRKLSEIAPAFRKIGENCVEAAADPAAGKYLVLPAGFDLDKAVTAAVDKLLVSGGLASWQTPAIQARGDLLMAAGGCRAKIGGARSDEIYKLYSRTNDLRERAYYAEAFQHGLEDPDFAELNVAQCAQAITSFMARAAKK